MRHRTNVQDPRLDSHPVFCHIHERSELDRLVVSANADRIAIPAGTKPTSECVAYLKEWCCEIHYDHPRVLDDKPRTQLQVHGAPDPERPEG